MFKGSNVALITPFKDNVLDEENYLKLINFHIENGTNGLVPAGTTGESLQRRQPAAAWWRHRAEPVAAQPVAEG